MEALCGRTEQVQVLYILGFDNVIFEYSLLFPYIRYFDTHMYLRRIDFMLIIPVENRYYKTHIYMWRIDIIKLTYTVENRYYKTHIYLWRIDIIKLTYTCGE